MLLNENQLQLQSKEYPPIKVSKLVSALKNCVEENYKNVRVIGEISSFKRWRSGHCYFDVKDENALIPAVMFSGFFQKLNFTLKDGLEVILTGNVSIYSPQSRLQMIVHHVEPVGEGALALQFQRLKEKLAQNGLFALEHKKPLPKYSFCLGVVTSTHGAVLRDIIKVLSNRNPKISLVVCSARVQGAGAKEEIAEGIRRLDDFNGCDAIIVARGGGSLEDLWAFNEEVVANAIFKAKTPIISAVGHETDFSISDLVADIRAATPSHAAEIACMPINELLAGFKQNQMRLKTLLKERVTQERKSLDLLAKTLKDPRLLLFKYIQKVDELHFKFNQSIKRLIGITKNSLVDYKKKLDRLSPIAKFKNQRLRFQTAKQSLLDQNPLYKIKKHQEKIFQQEQLLGFFMKKILQDRRKQVDFYEQSFSSLSLTSTLNRGYSLVRGENNRLVKSIKDVTVGKPLSLILSDGVVHVLVVNKEKTSGNI